MRLASTLLFSFLFAGCESAAAPTDGGAGTDLGSAVDAPMGIDSGLSTESYTLQLGPITVPPGPSGENTQCIVVRLHNPGVFHVGQMHNTLSAASHHMIVYRTNDTVERTTPFDCQPFTDTLNAANGSPLMITQRSDETLRLPGGVAFVLDPNQMIRIELHFINTTTAPLDALTTTTFTGIPDSDFRDAADFLFIGTPDIMIPAHTMVTVGPDYFPLPAEYADAHFFAITGHTHRFGVNVQVWTGPSSAGATTPVYDVPAFDWAEPDTVRTDPGFMVPAGGGFRFQCDYDNTSAAPVNFGESATKEMCFFWAYYYPSHGAKVCAHTDQFGGVDLCCPGSALCSAVFP